jgi:hypothetical protein
MSSVWHAAKSFGLFWYGFLVGDDWTIAAGIVVILGASYGLLEAAAIDSWWLLPLGALAVLALSIRRANRRAA